MKKHLLDLRDRGMKPIKVVERIIFKPRSPKVEAIKMFSVIVIVAAIGFGISSANDLVEKQTLQKSLTRNFSAIGIVSEINPVSISIVDAKGSNDKSQTSYTFDTSSVLKIETKTYVPLTLSDILVGDRIVVQGLDQDGTISVRRIISFTATSSREIILDVATSTATTTVETSTTTDSSGSSVTETPATTTDATSTPSIIETITDTVGNIVDKAKETIQNVINTITGTTTEPEGSSTPTDVSSSTPPASDAPVTPEVITPAPNPEPVPVSESPAPPADQASTQ